MEGLGVDDAPVIGHNACTYTYTEARHVHEDHQHRHGGLRRLRSVRRDKESFSQTIKRVIKPPFDYESFRKRLEGLSLSEEAAEAIEEQIRNRRRPSNRK